MGPLRGSVKPYLLPRTMGVIGILVNVYPATGDTPDSGPEHAFRGRGPGTLPTWIRRVPQRVI